MHFIKCIKYIYKIIYIYVLIFSHPKYYIENKFIWNWIWVLIKPIIILQVIFINKVYKLILQ